MTGEALPLTMLPRLAEIYRAGGCKAADTLFAALGELPEGERFWSERADQLRETALAVLLESFEDAHAECGYQEPPVTLWIHALWAFDRRLEALGVAASAPVTGSA